MPPRIEVLLGPGARGALACIVGIALLLVRSPLASAIGMELFALAFWTWARASDDAREQVPRWAWLRRPATALWLAVGLHAVRPAIANDPLAHGALRFALLEGFQAACIVWAGLELVAALPLARPYSDFPGPYLPSRPWIPVALPCAGFLVLWSLAPYWTGIEVVRRVVVALLLVTTLLAAFRAFARRGWTASLRWLAVAHTSLALIPLAARTLHPQAIFLLWLGAFGGPAFVLAGELTGASPRRGRLNARLWRAAGWTSTASVAWPALLTAGHDPSRIARVAGWAAGAVAVAISTWIMVGRLEVAPERRRIMRPGAGITAGRIAAAIIMGLGPAGLALGWWFGFEPHWLPIVLALLPAVVGGVLAIAPRQTSPLQLRATARRLAVGGRRLAAWAYRFAMRTERTLLAAVTGLARSIATPLRDLHTGDAQEYLLLLSGVALLALLIPLLR
jgi:hypothetical protein